MEKTLLKKHYKKGEFRIKYLNKAFVIGLALNQDDYTYIFLGPFSIEWFSYSKK